MRISKYIAVVMSALVMGALGQVAGEFEEVTNPRKTAEEVYESRDIEQVKAACLDPSLMDRLVVFASDEPDTPWREEVTLAMLEARWPSDRQPGRPTPPGVPPPLRLYQLAVNVLTKSLPEEDLKLNDAVTYEKLSTLEGRRLLVAKYREVQSSEEGDELPAAGEEEVEENANDDGREEGVSHFPKPDVEEASSEAKRQDDRDGTSGWMLGLAILGLAVLLGLYLCFRAWNGKLMR